MLEHAQLAGMKLPANCSRLRQVTATKAQPRTTSLGSERPNYSESEVFIEMKASVLEKRISTRKHLAGKA